MRITTKRVIKSVTLLLAITLLVTAMNLAAFAETPDKSAVLPSRPKSASSNVNVPADVKPVKSYTAVQGKAYSLPAGVKKDGDTYSSSNSSMLKVNETTGNFTPLSSGTAYIIVKNNGSTRYIKVTINGGATVGTSTAKSALSGYPVTVNDQTTPAVSASSNTWPIQTLYFYSANGKVLGSISGETLDKIIKDTGFQGDAGLWTAEQFNLYRGITATTNTQGSGAVKQEENKQSTSSLGELINTQRRKDGISELTYDSSMQDLADERAKELAVSFSHTRPDGTHVAKEYSYAEIAHNGTSSSTAQTAFQGFYNSTSHKDIMLDERYSYYAVGRYEAENGRIYWIGLFSK